MTQKPPAAQSGNVVRDVTILVMGEAAPRQTYPKHQTLGSACETALKSTTNTGDLSKYKLTDATGRHLSFEDTFEKAQIPDGARLRLDRKSGQQA